MVVWYIDVSTHCSRGPWGEAVCGYRRGRSGEDGLEPQGHLELRAPTAAGGCGCTGYRQGAGLRVAGACGASNVVANAEWSARGGGHRTVRTTGAA